MYSRYNDWSYEYTDYATQDSASTIAFDSFMVDEATLE
jgi:hypothetical protein